MHRIIQSIILVILSFIMISSSCDKDREECSKFSQIVCCDGSNVCDESICSECPGCTDFLACNYDNIATFDDSSCWYAIENCSCEDPQGSNPDCLGVCDLNINNDAPDIDGDGICDDDVIGGCMDSQNCNYNSNATHPNDSCMMDLTNYGSPYNDGRDCIGTCGGDAIMDVCDNPNCIGSTSMMGQSWRLRIHATTKFVSTSNNSILGIDTNTVTLGTSIFALDEYNGNVDGCVDECYPDIPAPPGGLNSNTTRFYFPHEEWIFSSEISNENFFVQDIRSNDLQALFSTGIQWDAIIYPINISLETIMETISLSFEYLEGINSCSIIIKINNGIDYVVSDGEMIEFAVNSDNEIYLTFIITDICFSQ